MSRKRWFQKASQKALVADPYACKADYRTALSKGFRGGPESCNCCSWRPAAAAIRQSWCGAYTGTRPSLRATCWRSWTCRTRGRRSLRGTSGCRAASRAATPVVAELDYQLTQWYEALPAPLQFSFARAPPPLRYPAQTVLKLRYYACKVIIYRPYIYCISERRDTSPLSLYTGCKKEINRNRLSFAQVTRIPHPKMPSGRGAKGQLDGAV
ncbi:hypothetical protein MY1884_003291 [Beauveria asiatica]